MTLFVDTGAFLGRSAARDQYHSAARSAWKQLPAAATRLATSNFVIGEFATLLGRRSGYGFATEHVRAIYASRKLQVLRPDADDEAHALDLFLKYSDQAVSFTDCLSFALMRRHGIDTAFTFDAQFERAGFTRWP